MPGGRRANHGGHFPPSKKNDDRLFMGFADVTGLESTRFGGNPVTCREAETVRWNFIYPAQA
jgi:hypothetical protein